MSDQITRRETLMRGLAAGSLLALIPDWAMPARAQGDTEVTFTDLPKNYNPGGAPGSPTRQLDIRKIDGMLTPKEQFFTTQHFTKPEIDPAGYRLKFTGMVTKPAEFSLAELKAMKSVQLVNGFECSGNSGRSIQGLSSCGRFTGVPLSAVLKQVGVHPDAREVVFFGTDRGPADVAFRTQTYKLDQQFGRSVTLENAMKPEPMLAYAMNGDPLTLNQGFPVRLIMPGWYGVANVKWLSEVHLQEERYLGNYPGALVPFGDRRRRHRSGHRSGYAVGGKRNHPNASEVGHRARDQERRGISGSGLRFKRRFAAEIGGSQDRRRSLAEGDVRSGQHSIFLEAVHL